jgi:hypothetical protein
MPMTLLSPVIESLQKMVIVCELELAWLDMALNAKKLVSLYSVWTKI